MALEKGGKKTQGKTNFLTSIASKPSRSECSTKSRKERQQQKQTSNGP